MQTLTSLILMFATALSVAAAGEAKVDMSTERFTEEGRTSIRWVECHYKHWVALACWRDSEKERVTHIQIFVPQPDSSWVCLQDEKVPYAKIEADRVDHIDPVPIGRTFMVIDRSEILSFSYLGYVEEKEPNKRPETNAGRESVSPTTPGPGVAHP